MNRKFARVLLKGNDADGLAILREYADFWKVPYTETALPDENHLIFTTSPPEEIDSQDHNPLIVAPTGIEGAAQIARQFRLKVTHGETSVRLRITPTAAVSLNTMLYRFSGADVEQVLKDHDNTLLYKIRESSVYIISVDLISEFQRLMHGAIDEAPNWKFRVLTRLPFSYKIIPAKIRNRAFKARGSVADLKENLGPIEFLRHIFLAALVIASNEPIPIIGFWRRGKSCALAVSHDVETQPGLEDGAGRLIETERELGIRSTWNIPSDRYPLSSQLLIALAEKGEVGGHDTKHDGRLFFASTKTKLDRVKR